ncbi:hypothetical protein PUN28_009778 [Cardiocondyla obscurior]|uniref:Uncharacterized protein n=1 Tax=Cardiocondyla obscurior TaxID=286306 RepID=A0AAW2FMX2_9HYME
MSEKKIEIELVDEENNKHYKIKVSSNDVERAKNDVMFATKLLEITKLQSNAESNIHHLNGPTKQLFY